MTKGRNLAEFFEKRRKSLWLGYAVIAIGLVGGDERGERTAEVEAFLAAAEAQRVLAAVELEEEIGELKASISKAKRGRVTGKASVNGGNGNRTYASAAAKKEDVARLTERLGLAEARLKAAKDRNVIWIPKIDMRKIGVGQIGSLMASGIVDRATGRAAPADAGSNIEFRVVSIADPEAMLVSWGSDLYWIAGYPTAGLVDEQKIRLEDCFYVSGTQQYEAVDGSSPTVFRLERFDPEQVRRILDEKSD